MSFSFGNTTQTSNAFGSTPAKTGFGSGFTFGTSGAATTTSTGFTGFGNVFGASQTATSTTNTVTPSFGVGITPTTTTFGSFGVNPTTNTTPNLFSGFGTSTSAPAQNTFNTFSGFGTTTTASSGLGSFGSTFGAKPTTTTGFGGFNSSLGSTTLGTLQQPQIDSQQALYNSLFSCNVFGDERDAVLAKWNILQATWGTGRGYYNPHFPPVEYNQVNPYCKFKAIAYSVIPGHENKEGLVAIVFNKKEAEIKAQKVQLIQSLGAVMGNKSNLFISIYSIRATAETKSQVLFFVQEKGTTGTIRKIPATDLANYLLQPMQKQQLINLGVENVFAHVRLDSDQLKEYLNKAPAGIDARIWKQAQIDNPNPNKYIPIPLIGYEQLKWRSKCQEKETALHRGFLDQVSKDIIELKQKHAASVSQIADQKRKLLELQHRVLRILVKQEVSRKVGMTLQPEEEILKGQLENMQAQISMPTQFKGRLNELLAQIRILNQNGQMSTSERYTMDQSVQEDIKQFLKMEQKGIQHLIEIITTDLSHLKMIKEGMQELIQKR